MAAFKTKQQLVEAAQVPISVDEKSFSEMDQRKNDFLATLAHELRNPLAPIKNGLQLLAFMNLNKDAEIVCAMMARQVEQVVHLVDDLLDISRVSCGKIKLNKQICTVRSFVDAGIEEAAILISENGMSLEVQDRSHSACVCGDLCRLTQVICNLLNNAAKYGYFGGAIVMTITTEGKHVCIGIKDNGVGIPPSKLNDIFTMYSQIETAQGGGVAGLGIGLSLVRSLVELHDGSIEAESEGEGFGSTFTVRLPIAPENSSPQTPLKVKHHQPANPLRVVVVDDLRAMRFVTKNLLIQMGHTVQLAENGSQALKLIDLFEPDVLISDITMPVMGGIELARSIRSQSKYDHILLVALSGRCQSSDRKLALEAGFDRHLSKPIDFQDLQSLLNELKNPRRKVADRHLHEENHVRLESMS